MAYTDIDNPELYFQTQLYNGSNSGQSITFDGSENMQPDWVWIKSRNGSGRNHCLYDVVRGVNKRLEIDGTGAENTDSGQLTSFDSDGYTVGTTEADINSGGRTFASWNWKAGGSASNNTDGSITTTVSANTTSGFSIMSYTGTGSNATLGHGLNNAPKLVIIKQRNGSDQSWCTFHTSLGAGKFIDFNRSDPTNTNGSTRYTSVPSSTVINIGNSDALNSSNNTFICYAFAEKQGFSKFGSYTGNGNTDGPFVYTGFKPAFVICKITSGTDQWVLYDNKRDTFNVTEQILRPNTSGAEGTESGAKMDLLSNGFKLRGSGGGIGQTNNSGGSYIYMAFAENPFVTSTGIPSPAK
jgi:hypothetical protein